MLTKLNHIGWALFVFLLLTGVLLWATDNFHIGSCSAEVVKESVLPEHDHDHLEPSGESSEHELSGLQSADGHLLKEDVNESAQLNPDLGALEKLQCEHQIHTVACDNCRFEAGVVKVEHSLAGSLLKTAVAEELERARVLKLTGQVDLDQMRVVDVVSPVSGRVERVVKLLGDEISESAVLAVIHSADLGEAKARFLEVQAQLKLSQATLDREKELYLKKISSEADYLDALNELQASKAYFAAAEKRLHIFGLDTDQIQAIQNEEENGRFAELVLRAPRAGTIIAQNISAGKLVETTNTLYTIADLSNYWVWCDVYEEDLAVLHEQMASGKELKAKIRVKAYQGEEFEGVVDLIGSMVDEHTRTVKVRIQVKNEQGKLKAGMFTDAEISIPTGNHFMAVPRSAILSDDGRDFVFMHWKDDLWVRRDVVLGENQGVHVEIVRGITNGDTIVVNGAFMLKSDILREKMGAGCAE